MCRFVEVAPSPPLHCTVVCSSLVVLDAGTPLTILGTGFLTLGPLQILLGDKECLLVSM